MSSAVPMAQLNVRIPADLKRRGDAAITQAGVTPTQVIRTMWEMFAQGPSGVGQFVKMVIGDEEVIPTQDEIDEEAVAADELHDRIMARHLEFMAQAGFDPDNPPPYPDMTDEELLMSYYEDRDRERMPWYADVNA